MRAAEDSKRIWIFLGTFVLCAALVKPLQESLDARLNGPEPDPDLLYFNSHSLVKRMELSYDRLLADFYWMRAIQYYGRRDKADRRAVRYKNLATLLDITTTLDPDLMEAYHAGSVFLGEEDPVGAGQPQQALKLLDKGIRMHPGDWRLQHEKGLVYYWYIKDYGKAGEVWNKASLVPGAPHWMQPLAAMALSKGGSLEIAVALWQSQYEDSTRADVRENARNHLLSIQTAQDIWSLEVLVESYRDKNGAFPQSLNEVVRGKSGKYRIADPLGTPYQYNPATGAVSLSPDTKVKYLQVPYSYKEQFQTTIER